jgi:hypothetical protein
MHTLQSQLSVFVRIFQGQTVGYLFCLPPIKFNSIPGQLIGNKHSRPASQIVKDELTSSESFADLVGSSMMILIIALFVALLTAWTKAGQNQHRP